MKAYSGSFFPTPDDTVNALRMNERMPVDAWKLQLFGSLLLLATIATIAVFMDFLFMAVIGAVIAPVFFVVPWLRDRTARRVASTKTAEKIFFEFSDEGISYRSPNWSHQHSWAVVKKAVADSRGLLVYAKDGGFSFIPARAFGPVFPAEKVKLYIDSKLAD